MGSPPSTRTRRRALRRRPGRARLGYPPAVERQPPRDDDATEADGLEYEGAPEIGLDDEAYAEQERDRSRPGRHVLRAILAVGIIVLLFAIPDLSTQPDRTGLTAYRGQIVEIDATRTPRPDQGFEPNVRVRLSEGPQAGQIVDAYLEGPGGSLDISTYRAGD